MDGVIELKGTGDFQALVPTSCGSAFIMVTGWTDKDPEWKFIDIQLIDALSHGRWPRWKDRIRNAWRTLMNRYDWSGFAIDERYQAEALIEALTKAQKAAWPDEV